MSLLLITMGVVLFLIVFQCKQGTVTVEVVAKEMGEK